MTIEKKTMFDTIETLEGIEDGLLALQIMATANRDEICEQREFNNAYNFVYNKVFDDLQTVRADLVNGLGTAMDHPAEERAEA